MQRQRFELKYHISPDTAQAVEDIVRRRLKRDDNSVPQGSRGYPAHSLYLDTAALRLYHSTINGERNRFKLPVRFYDDVPTSPDFLEIKRRNNNCISKQRATVHRTAIPELLLGGWPRLQHLHTKDARQLEAARNFCRLTAELHALPCSHVAYERDAWTSHHDNSVRVTFDRNVRCEPSRLGLIPTHLQQPEQVFPLHTVILEIKFTDRFPEWLGDMIQTLGLRTASAAKYIEGVSLFGPEKFRSRTPYTLVS